MNAVPEADPVYRWRRLHVGRCWRHATSLVPLRGCCHVRGEIFLGRGTSLLHRRGPMADDISDNSLRWCR